MRAVTGWWVDRSQVERFDLLTRGPLYLLSAAEPAAALLIVLGQTGRHDQVGVRPVGVAVLAVVVLAHTAACLRLLHTGVEHGLGGPPPPRGLLATVLGLAAAGQLAGLAAFPEPWQVRVPSPAGVAPGSTPLVLAVLLLFGVFTFAAFTPVVPRPALAGLVVLPAAAVGIVQGMVPVEDGAAPWAADVLLALLATAFTYRTSIWLLGIVWAIDRSREVEARLAVAEERLRFSRDLHDVLGRNLALVAIGSDLAAQLLRRGHEGALEQMEAVNRTAQESLRELREVVHGYRTVDLGRELAGARSLLDAAGIDVVVTGADPALPPPELQVALGWAVREAVTNVIRHSEAATVLIRLDVDAGVPGGSPGSVVLRIENDGVTARSGRVVAETRRGTGLSGVQERLTALGGTLTARPDPSGDRFLTEARLPLSADVARVTPSPAGDVPSGHMAS